jgi:hypothetical protein
MKQCPKCSREYDNSMMFCLDDGAELLYGPASIDAPATAVFGIASSGSIAEIRWTNPFQSLHDDPRFRVIFRRMGMPN